MTSVKICGVPEHFNMPWHLALEEGAFEDKGIALEWIDVPEGTGRMSKMLTQQETDLAVILTEGIVKSISEGNPSKIVQTYVTSPLYWGIYVSSDSNIRALEELEGKKATVSRLGSGSHLMAVVHAQQRGWDPKHMDFVVVHHLEGAVESLRHGDSDYFMWEHFTTKPLVDDGTFRWLGDCPTPWPCFVIAATEQFILDHTAALKLLLETINLYTREFKWIPSIDRSLAIRYSQQLEDIQLWLSKTQWGQQQLESTTLQSVLQKLDLLELLGEIKEPKHFLNSF